MDKKNVNLKKFIIRIGALIILGLSFYLITTIFRYKSPHGINQIEGMYWQPKESIDVVMLGTSHVHCGINTGLLWEKYGIPAYDYSGAEQPLWMTYYYLKELYKYQSPEVIVLDLYAPARYKEDYQYNWISENIYGMRFSVNKLEMLFASVEINKINQYFPSFFAYHSRYKDLGADDFNSFFWDRKEKEAFKGYTPYWNKRAQERPKEEIFTEVQAGELTIKSEEYLRKIIQFTKEKDSELILVVVPYVETEDDRKTYLEIEKIAEEEEITFINYNELYDEIGIDYANDFNDDSHLNYWGSCKFTEYLGDFLITRESVANRKNQEGYESWDKNALLILNESEKYNNP